jgi:hypothetical protein
MRYLERFVRDHGHQGPLAYFSLNWRRDASPLLDHLAAVIDHVEAWATGGAHDQTNFVTACNKCNMRKSSAQVQAFRKRHPPRPVKGKYGDPQHWDGLTAVFVLLLRDRLSTAPASDRAWYQALTQDPVGHRAASGGSQDHVTGDT